MAPTISIITISKNSAATIAGTIESIRAQSCSCEYIVIDGESKDATQEIVKGYGELVTDFVSEPDAGISDAFNKGIARAHGDIIGLLNSDDCLLPDALQKVTRYFAEHPEVDVIHGDVLLYSGNLFVKRVAPPSRWWCPWRLVLFNHPATFVRRRVYQQLGGFSAEYKIAMDVEIFLRWKKAQVSVVYYPEALVKMATGGLSKVRAKQGYQEVRQALLAYGFSKPLVHLQYYGKIVVETLLTLRS